MSMASLASRLLDALGPDVVRTEAEDLAVYGFDAYSDNTLPSAVVVPSSAREVAVAVRVARDCGEPVVPRGAGTGLCGGAVPSRGARSFRQKSGFRQHKVSSSVVVSSCHGLYAVPSGVFVSAWNAVCSGAAAGAAHVTSSKPPGVAVALTSKM